MREGIYYNRQIVGKKVKDVYIHVYICARLFIDPRDTDLMPMGNNALTR